MALHPARLFSIVRKSPDEIHVRARWREDLLNLKAAVAIYMGKAVARRKIHGTEPADWPTTASAS